MYGPEYARRPMADTIAPIKDALESLTPEEKYLIDSTGETVSRRVNSSMLFKQALQTGETTSSLTQQVQAAEAADSAYKLAEQASSLSDQEFQQAMQELQNEMQGNPQMPVPGQVQQPDRLSQALAAIFSVATPEHAFSIGAVPYQNQMRIRDENYQIQLKQYGADIAQRDDRIKIAELKLKMAAQNREESSQRLYQMAAEASRRGEAKRAAGLKARGDLAKASSLADLKDQIQVMRENFPDMLPDKEVLDGYRNQLELGAKAAEEKAKLELDKANEENINREVDNFRANVSANFPPGSTITKAQADEINKQAEKYAKEAGIPRDKFMVAMERISSATENSAFTKQKYQDEQSGVSIEGQIKRETLKGLIAKNEKALQEPVSKDKATKQKQFAKVTESIEKAREKLDALKLQDPPPIGTYANGSPNTTQRDAYYDKIREAFAEELSAVRRKRQLAGGKPPTADEYLKERYPELYGAKKAGQKMIEKLGDLFGAVKADTAPETQPKGAIKPALPPGVTG